MTGGDKNSGEEAVVEREMALTINEAKGRKLIISQNIRSLKKNSTKLMHLLNSLENVTVAALQEVWQIDSINVNLPGYELVKKTRKNKNGGGVAIAIQADMKYSTINTLFLEGIFESIGIETTINGKQTTIINVYKPPNTNKSTFLQLLNTLPLTKHTVLLGDFNIDCSDPRNIDFLEQLTMVQLCPLITKPTRITGKSQTVIDNIFTNLKRVNGNVILTELSDHFTVALEFQGKNKHKKTSIEFHETPLHDNRSIKYLSEYLRSTNWDHVTRDHTKASFAKFENTIQEAMKICCPLQKRRKNPMRPIEPWYTKGLLQSKFTKEKLLKQAYKSKLEKDWITYRNYRNLYNKCTRKQKQIYYEKKFEESKKDPKETWKLANELTGRKGEQKPIGLLENTKTNQETATAFNDFFVSVGEEQAKKVRDTGTEYKQYKPIKKPPKLKLRKVTPKEIEHTIQSMASKTSYSHDNLSNKIVKFIRKEISEPLSHLVNLSIATNYIPPNLKVAKVVPIHKKGDHRNPTNFRPISLLPTFSKVLEKIVAKQVYDHLENNKLLYKHQYGFRKRHNCEQLLHTYVNHVNNAKEKKEHTLAIFLDCAKAFDSVPTKKLIEKLEWYGLPKQWFQEYLNNRKQYVTVNGCKSRKKNIDYGVPQGSILGPLLFLIYINDLHEASNFLTLLYADDTSLLLSGPKLGPLYNKANELLKDVEKWFQCNSLNLHPQKTRYILYSSSDSPRNLTLLDNTIIRVGRNQAEKVFKLVGVHLSDHLGWKEHITHIRKKVLHALQIINRSKSFLPRAIKIMLYKSLVQSHLEYCLPIWGAGPETKILEKVQKRAVRTVTNNKYNAHADPIFANLGILKITDLYKLRCIEIGVQAAHDNTVSGLKSIYKTATATVKTRYHGTTKLYIPKFQLEMTRLSPTYQIPSIYNNMSNHANHPNKLATSYRNTCLVQYKLFRCANPNCYICQRN